ncbi:uncharacterized protein LOC111288744 [Durio zibethinus]|uniref:Uncharacterized protein LOC111288744 n=1 Tax=Durio zibethinus TaxID=66656 RepID=A0A6P5Y4V0_DURZI|nr:uncharacterized protein LOC111288744 [Durio zibethinus]
MADAMKQKLQQSLQESSVLDTTKTEIGAAMEESSVLDTPKSEIGAEMEQLARAEFALVIVFPEAQDIQNIYLNWQHREEIASELVYDTIQESGATFLSRSALMFANDSFLAPPMSPKHPDLWSQQRWKSTLCKAELKQRCARCKEMGHSHKHCPYPIIYVTVPDLGGGPDQLKPVVWTPVEGKYRCSRCGRRGHNRRTCHGPVFY